MSSLWVDLDNIGTINRRDRSTNHKPLTHIYIK